MSQDVSLDEILANLLAQTHLTAARVYSEEGAYRYIAIKFDVRM